MKRKHSIVTRFTLVELRGFVIIEVNFDGTIPSMPFWDGRNSWVSSYKNAREYNSIQVDKEIHHILRMRQQEE